MNWPRMLIVANRHDRVGGFLGAPLWESKGWGGCQHWGCSSSPLSDGFEEIGEGGVVGGETHDLDLDLVLVDFGTA